MTTQRSLTGGAQMGFWGATWPLARLSANREWINLRVRLGGEYSLHASQVVAVRKHIFIPFLAWGVRIHHGAGNCPKKLVFWSWGFPSSVLAFLREEGFPQEKIDPS